MSENKKEIKEVDAKKEKKWNPNPWAVCQKNISKDKNPEKFERCVMDVKKKQAFNLKRYLQAKKIEAQDYSQTQPTDGVQKSDAAKVVFKDTVEKDSVANLLSQEPELRDLAEEDRKLWINEPLRNQIIAKFKEQHPKVSATIKQILEWYRKNFTHNVPEFDFNNRDKKINP